MIDEVKALDHITQIDKAGMGEMIERLAGVEPEGVEALLAKSAVPEADRLAVRAAARLLGADLTARLLKGASKKAAPTAPEAEGEGPKDEAFETCTSCAGKLAKSHKFCPMCGADTSAAADGNVATDGGDNQPTKKAMKKADLAALPAAQRSKIEALFKAQESETADLREKLEKAESERARIEDERRRETFIAKAREFKHLPGAAADDLGPILMKAERAMEKSEYEKLTAILKGADAIAADSALFDQLGSTVNSDGNKSAYGRVAAMAEELRKGDASLSPERARAKIIKAHPELYQEHQRELDELKRQQRGS